VYSLLSVKKDIQKLRPELWLLGGTLLLLATWIWRVLKAQSDNINNLYPSGYYGLNDRAGFAYTGQRHPGFAFTFNIPKMGDFYKAPFTDGRTVLSTESGVYITTEGGADILLES
jgi:hypothetical protein